MKSVIDEYISKKQIVFTAFIKLKDLRKPFDTALGCFINLSSFIKFNNGLIALFLIERGVKQGDVLCPVLFYYFIDDCMK